MDKKKIEIIAGGFLIIVFFFIVLSNLKGGKKEIYRQNISRVLKENTSFKNIDYESLNEKFDRMPWRKNPFGINTIKPKKISRSVSLQGILWDPVSAAVIFGDMFLKIGDKIEDYEILNIKEESVVLTDGELVYELRVGQSLDILE